MPPKKSKVSTRNEPNNKLNPINSRWIKCPRSPCLVSFNPRSAPCHAITCRYFRCLNQPCNYLGTQRQVDLHHATCPHSLPSEEIGTTDPLTEPPSDVLDILTSPYQFNSLPTDLSSAYYSESSPRKCPSSSLSQTLKSHRFKSSKVASTSENVIQLDPIPSTCNTNTNHHVQTKPTLDPYDPSSQRVFSLSLESINPNLRPAPAPISKSSSPAPPPPTRRLSTYELQRYRPDPESNQTQSLHPIKRPASDHSLNHSSLSHTTALYESLKKCFKSLLCTYDDYVYLASQKVTHLDPPEEIAGPSIEDFRQAYRSFLADEIPDLSFLDRHDSNLQENVSNISISSSSAPSMINEKSTNDMVTADQLADQVKLKIAELKRSSPVQMDSPSNIFSRKRQRHHPSTSQQSISSTDLQRPTPFMRKLADTTWELSDEIQTNLPSRCNFKKVLDDAQYKINKKVNNRKSC